MTEQKALELVQIVPPPAEQRVRRNATFAEEGEKKTRYHLPRSLDSASPIGYRTRVSLSAAEAISILPLLSLARPTRFVPRTEPVREREIFEECSIGILSARQSTNFRGHREVIVGPQTSVRVAEILSAMHGLEADILDNATHTHVVLRQPYRTAFTALLTFIGHKPVSSLVSVPKRAFDKRVRHTNDIPTVGYLPHLHLGILADAMERAALIASHGRRMAQVFMGPFCGDPGEENADAIRELEQLVGLTAAQKTNGWRIALVAQVGEVAAEEQMRDVTPGAWRKFGANLTAFRTERIQPGVNAEPQAPAEYQQRQTMDVPDELTVQCGRAGYNAFVHWTRCERERSKELCLLERVDVLTPNGKQRLREVRQGLDAVSDSVITNIPLWADLPTGKALSRNAARGKKAFALAGQRIYIGGLDANWVSETGVDWELALRAFGAAMARSALYAEIMGVVEIPPDCDLLAGVCLMAGPVNQNDIGKEFYGHEDLLVQEHPDHEPTSLLVWTLKAKTVADPIGNEEQLLSAERKGALVDLRPAPADIIEIEVDGRRTPFRPDNTERAYGDVANFVVSTDGQEIVGNRGTPLDEHLAELPLWS